MERAWAARTDAGHFARYVSSLWRYYGSRVSRAQCEETIRDAVRRREDTFLGTLDRAVYAQAESPYRRLLAHAGIEREDVEGRLRSDGLESTLATLHEAGVFVTLDEFKGRTPIRRGGLELPVTSADFDNPLGTRHYEGRTGGSGGEPRPILVDLASVAEDACHYGAVLAAFGWWDRPTAVWYPLPPGVAGMRRVLFNGKLGRPLDHWFGQSKLLSSDSFRPALTTTAAYVVARTRRRSFPLPKHTPAQEAIRVVRWLSEQQGRGTPALLLCTPSGGVRVCAAAKSKSLDIRATAFWFSGEALTPSKARAIADAGCTAVSQYNTSEAGVVGDPCATAESWSGDVHLASDKVALLGQSDARAVGDGAVALYLTTLSASSPKVMLNVETGDSAVLTDRACGCALEELGLVMHASDIRSYEKLTSEGMNVTASALLGLIEDVLPARFGGGPTDYQLVEDEANGVTRVHLLVSPEVGSLRDADVVDAVLGFLRSQGRPESQMAGIWREAETIRVIRARPHVTGAGKILPLHHSAPGRS